MLLDHKLQVFLTGSKGGEHFLLLCQSRVYSHPIKTTAKFQENASQLITLRDHRSVYTRADASISRMVQVVKGGIK